jgi:hypothetical protein
MRWLFTSVTKSSDITVVTGQMKTKLSTLSGKNTRLKWMCCLEWRNKKFVGLIFFFFCAEATVTRTVYLDMLQQSLEPQLIKDNILDTVVFQQNRSTCHDARIVQEYHNNHVPNQWLGRGWSKLWAASYPDLMLLELFAWGFIKSEVYRRNVQDLPDLGNRIREAVPKIPLKCL